MKKTNATLGISILILGLTFISCKKEHCHECHYDGPSGEIELGEKCESEIEDLEANGYTVDGINYEVHCHGH